MLEGAILTIVAFLLVLLKLSPKIRKRLLGYDLLCDAAVTIGLIFLFGGTGTISGMMISIVAGLLVSVALYIAKNTGKYQRLERKAHPKGMGKWRRALHYKWHWQEYDGKWRKSFTNFYNNMAGNDRHAIEGEAVWT